MVGDTGENDEDTCEHLAKMAQGNVTHATAAARHEWVRFLKKQAELKNTNRAALLAKRRKYHGR